MNEDQWQRKVLELATLYGWLVYHTHDSRRSQPGFPDLTMVKGERLVFVELKQEKKYPTPEQRKWLAALWGAGREVAVWRPSDLPEAVCVLGPRRERAVLEERYRP